MFIRKSQIKSKKSGGNYFSYRLVESTRIDGQVKQKTLLNLGKHFDIAQADWPVLAARINQIVYGVSLEQTDLFDTSVSQDKDLEIAAQRYAVLLIQKQSAPVLNDNLKGENCDYQTVDVNKIDVLKSRSVGIESLSLQALKQLKLDDKLRCLGFIEKDITAAIGTIIGRMAHPSSERETHRWLQENSGLGELIDYDYGTISLDRLYKVADKLLKNKTAIESHLAQREQELFNLERTIILYDLTNTYFEGTAKDNPQVAFGRSKEKRSDCPLVTMGLVLDGAGFPVGSKIFKGNASEPKTLKEMISGLSCQSKYKGSTVVLDAGITSQENLDWLKDNSYRYIVVSRERYKLRPTIEDGAVIVKDVTDNQVTAKYVTDEESGEHRLYCHSQKREKKESAILNQFHQRFEANLKTLNDGLTKKGTTKTYEKVLEKLGRLKKKHTRVSADYTIIIEPDEDKKQAIKIHWERNQSANDKDNLAGVYCLRTTVDGLSEKELWETYVMLTDVESSFKSMKSKLGLRPIYHQKEERVTAHLFITLIAYHIVHSLRTQLKEQDVSLSWNSIRHVLSSMQRVTVSLPTLEGNQIHVRSSTKPEPGQKQIFNAIQFASDPLGAKKTVF